MTTTRSSIYPVLPLKDVVVFPHMVIPLFVGRDKSVAALEAVMQGEKQILLVTQKDAQEDSPSPQDLYALGTIATVLQLLKLPDGTVKVLVEGQSRATLMDVEDNGTYFEAAAGPVQERDMAGEDVEALMRTVVSQFEQYIKLNQRVPPEALVTVSRIEEPAKLADSISSHLNLKISEKQDLLETFNVADRLEKVYGYMEGEIGVMKVEKRIRSRVKRQMEKTQREYYLNEQMKAIQKELGETEDGHNELSEIEERAGKVKMTKEAREKFDAELKKLKMMSPMSAEATVIRNYLDVMLSLPWRKYSKVKKDLKRAEIILDEDHYGLEKVKERILEYLAVQNRVRDLKGPILCLVGPPGVGKTSLGKSIARATNRNFVRVSLGGVRDESEIRGHRRTYIGSMPGKVVQSLKKAKTSNPLFLLDEIDKIGMDWRGDPASALLEVLDPAQNSTFSDHYLELDYDLSKVLFLCTANSTRMPGPLLDRMELIRISGYTEDEKVEIAKQHLIPRQLKDNGLKEGELEITESALRDLCRYYTREAGVRNLEREIANLCRKSVKAIDMKERDGAFAITNENLGDFAGVRKFRYGLAEENNQVGAVTGLAWTEVGGDLLQIESVTVNGKGRAVFTGQLGDVMKESIQTAESFVKSRAADFGIKPDLFAKRDIHVHVPEGATPKDGPSAGIAMVTSIVSVLTGNPVRNTVAMTGEVTLRGKVLPIGGLKEKLLAALRGGISKVLIPIENEKDLAEIPDNVKEGLEIVPVSDVDEVLGHALAEALTPLTAEQIAEFEAAAAKAENPSSTVVTH